MSLATMLDETCTIISRAQTGAVDRYNSPTWVETSTAGVACYIEQTQPKELTIGRETQIADFLGAFLADTVLDGSDRVIQGTHTYEVIGPPWEVWNPRTASVDHIEANLREVT